MDISLASTRDGALGEITDLAANIVSPRYSMKQVVPPAGAPRTWLQAQGAPISLVVIEGALRISNPHASRELRVGREDGVYITPGANLMIEADTGPAKYVLASAPGAELRALEPARAGASFPVTPLSSYRVEKPWGFERWYTQGIAERLPYSLKLIALKKGAQSSLQSHVQKSETNYVIEGEIELLYGLKAPADLSAKIDVSRLSRKIYRPGEGWSNAVGELHRLIAKTDSKCVEASTPELDDVIRWQDDTARPNGRIEGEHQMGARKA